ncbi:carboxypeptidase regulatory-like domain-containing protein [Leucobacter viscericola]|uniref:Carboxypeptidase regulatory-like domain-containing protein n=1 Tax=Leucobacter viscericola TaxID=2714935 RepID=A0A6G7XIJ9_9MICO|nr:carboxypeptidase-like regulatory domain-containing protein [Leucobacter viscericola]QIK64395.1 carboxypeptidase regulatory-like domain-containing protein [Leucobacter viscericola]
MTRRVTNAALGLLGCVAMVGMTVGLAGDAAMAEPTVSGPTVALVSDGTAPFDAEDGPGLDSGAANGILRSQDTATWEVKYTGEAASTATFTATLPTGMQWTPASIVASVCNGPAGGSISADGLTLRCDRTVRAHETSAFPVSAVAGALPNGARVAPQFAVNGQAIEASAPVTISAAPRTGLSVRHGALSAGTEFNGVRGVSTQLTFLLGAERDPANPNFFGYEAIASPITFELDVPRGAVVSTPDSATLTTEQTAPGETVSVTINADGSPLDFLRAASNGFAGGLAASGLAEDARVIASYKLSLFVPYEGNIAVGQTVTLGGQLRGFDPVSMSGQSNFGDGFAPGFAPGVTCPAVPAREVDASCYGKRFTRAALPAPKSTYSTTSGADGISNIYADGDPNTTGTEAVLVGQRYNVQTNLFNAATAEEDLNGAYASLSWNPAQQHLTAAPQARLNSGVSSFSGFSGIQTSQPLAAEQTQIEYTDYAFANDAERKSLAAFSSSAPHWVQDPQELPGGLDSVSSVRLRILTPIAPHNTVGFVLPMQRSDLSKGLTVGAHMPWFWQYGAEGMALTKSNYAGSGSTITGLGGSVQAADALIRATVALKPTNGSQLPGSQAERGDIVELKVTPVAIGPLSGGNATLRDAQVRVALPSACVKPLVSALPTGATFTPGGDGTDCNTAVPGIVTVPLGDVAAPAGAPQGSSYPGRSTRLGAIVLPLVIDADLSVPAQLTVPVVVASSSDPTVENNGKNPFATMVSIGQDRTEKVTLRVSGAASFNVSTVDTTRVQGEIGPLETVTHSLLWTNTSATSYQRGSFVSVLPFEGDGRGTSGLGTAATRVLGVGASVPDDPAAAVAIDYSTDAPEDVATALDRTGNADGRSGINWMPLDGAIPASVTAFRFSPQTALQPGTMGAATISYRAPTIEHMGALGNDVSFAVGNGGEQLNVRHGTASLLESSSAMVTGTVYRTDTEGGPAQAWPAADDGLELVDESGDVTAGAIAQDGTFRFDGLQPGTYAIHLKAALAEGWYESSPSTVSLEPAESVTGVQLVMTRAKSIPKCEEQPCGAPNIVTGKSDTHTATIPEGGTAAFVLPRGVKQGSQPAIQVHPKRGKLSFTNEAILFDATGIAPGTYTFRLLSPGENTDEYSVTVQQKPKGSGTSLTIDGDADSISFDPVGQTTGVNLMPLAKASLHGGIGSVSLRAGRVVYTPPKDFAGVDALSVDVVDDLGQRLTLRYTVVVVPTDTGSGFDAKEFLFSGVE